MGLIIHQIDAFSAEPFKGNPAAVCVLGAFPPEARMQALAMEMNLSETAFIVGRTDDGFDLRWFTPAVEVDLCGHATLAGAHALWEQGVVAEDRPIHFHTRSGLLTVRREGDWIEMDFPTEPSRPVAAPQGLAEALGCEPVNVEANRMDLLVEVVSEAAVRELAPDMGALRRVEHPRGVIVTARSSEEGCDFVSRFFAPRAGIDEDPVTGSAHCSLTPYWADRLGRDRLRARQVSARGGELRLRQAGGRVFIQGQAVTVFRAELDEGMDFCNE